MIPPTTREELIRRVDAGERFTYLPFYAARSSVERPWLSQWFPCTFTVDGVTYSSAEQFMMAEKARTFGDTETLTKILANKHPAKVKQLGREVRHFDQAKWEAVRFDVVVRGSIAKFSTDLKPQLLGTGQRILIEAAPRDAIWGVGLSIENPHVLVPKRWRGRNLLGFALTQARYFLSTR